MVFLKELIKDKKKEGGPDENIQKFVAHAYKTTLETYHGWIVKKVFSVSELFRDLFSCAFSVFENWSNEKGRWKVLKILTACVSCSGCVARCAVPSGADQGCRAGRRVSRGAGASDCFCLCAPSVLPVCARASGLSYNSVSTVCCVSFCRSESSSDAETLQLKHTMSHNRPLLFDTLSPVLHSTAGVRGYGGADCHAGGARRSDQRNVQRAERRVL